MLNLVCLLANEVHLLNEQRGGVEIASLAVYETRVMVATEVAKQSLLWYCLLCTSVHCREL